MKHERYDPQGLESTFEVVRQADGSAVVNEWSRDTGNTTRTPTADEVAALEAREREDRQRNLDGTAGSLLPDLRAIRDGTGNLNTSQATEAIRLLARACIIIIRLLTRRLDAED